MSKKYHYVYQTKNIVTGKTYIGIHSTNNLADGYIGSGVTSQGAINNQENACNRGDKSRSYIVSAFIKYGYHSFRKEILSFYDTREEAVEEEKFLVDEKWVRDTSNYNTALGGLGGNPRKHLEKYIDIEKDFLSGLLAKDLCKKYGVGESVISDAIKNSDRSKRDWDAIFIKKYEHLIPQIEDLTRTYIPRQNICKILKIDSTTLKKLFRLKSLELPTPPLTNYIAIHKNGMVERFTSFKVIADKYNIFESGLRETLTTNSKTYKDWVVLKESNYNKDSFIHPTNKYDKFLGMRMLSPEGVEYTIETSLTDFCTKHNLVPSNLYCIINGKMTTSRGWKILSKEFIKKEFIVKPLKFEHLSKEIEALLGEGCSIRSIAEQLGATPPSIRSVITKFNLKTI